MYFSVAWRRPAESAGDAVAGDEQNSVSVQDEYKARGSNFTPHGLTT
jgi:hypothetical protein